MSSKLIVSALGMIAAIAVIAAPQDPSFEYPAAKHVGFDAPKEEAIQSSQSSDRVSVTFRNAPVREVLDWLKDQGVSFVLGDDQIDKDARININVLNQSMDQLMSALAGAWNGHWERKDKIWVFKKGRDFFGDDTIRWTPGGAAGKNPARNLLGDGPLVGSKDGVTVIADGPGQMTKAQREAFEKAMKSLDDPKAWEEFQKTWQQWSKDHEKSFQELEKTFKSKTFDFKMDEKQLEEMRKHGQNFHMAPNGKGFIYDGKNFKPMDEKAMKEFHEKMKDFNGFTPDSKEFQQQMKELQEHMKNFKVVTPDSKEFQQHMKELQEHMKDFKVVTPDSKEFQQHMKELEGHMKEFKMLTPDSKEFRKLNEQQMKELRESMKNFKYVTPDGELFKRQGSGVYLTPGRKLTEKQMKELRDQGIRVYGQGRNGTTFIHGPEVSTSVSTHNLKAIWESMTPAQEQKMKRLGYINYSDLNSKQRSLLGIVTDESWTISYKTDKANLTIKSDR